MIDQGCGFSAEVLNLIMDYGERNDGRLRRGRRRRRERERGEEVKEGGKKEEREGVLLLLGFHPKRAQQGLISLQSSGSSTTN